MPKVKAPKLSRLGVLKKVQAANLLAFLGPYRDYLKRRGFAWPDSEAALDCNALARVLAAPHPDMPPDLVDQLELVDLLGEEQQYLAFESDYSALVQKLQDPRDSAADIAMRILRHNPRIAWKAFDKRALTVHRALSSFLADEAKAFRPPTDERIAKIEAALAPLFDKTNRSSACRVNPMHEDGQWAFVIRHGEPVARIGTISETGESGSLLFRPERLDVAYFNPEKREWLISGGSKVLKEMYREQFGAVFHGSRHALSPSDRYTLDPLRQGPAWLNDHGMDGLRAVMLKEITIQLPVGVNMKLTRGDVFAELMRQRGIYGEGIEFVEATFALLLRHMKRILHVKVKPLRNVVSGAGGIGLVDEWLENRGFVLTDANTEILANR